MHEKASGEIDPSRGLDDRRDLPHRPDMQTKLATLKAAAAVGDWPEALRIAARFPRLGDDAPAIQRAHEAAWHPAFFRQLGRDPDALVRSGIEALRRRYGLA